MSTLLSIGMLLGGLALVFYGANFLTDGASSIARRMQVSALVIGLQLSLLALLPPNLPSASLVPYRGKRALH